MEQAILDQALIAFPAFPTMQQLPPAVVQHIVDMCPLSPTAGFSALGSTWRSMNIAWRRMKYRVMRKALRELIQMLREREHTSVIAMSVLLNLLDLQDVL